MKRRDFIKAFFACLIIGHDAPEIFAKEVRKLSGHQVMDNDSYVKDYLNKMRNFNRPHPNDICLGKKDLLLLDSTVSRLKRLQRTVGYGNFHLLSVDDAIKTARTYSRIGRFPKPELEFMENIFSTDAARYGFADVKPLPGFTDKIDKRASKKVHGTGHYLYCGAPLETYQKIKKELGDNVILTSGVRGIVKQFLLFLNKTVRNNGNLSLASRSLAPPGYSFHGIGDFDVGQVNFGVANFTGRFTTTEVYHDLISMGYAQFRYPQDNMLGVRFEPWHIKLNKTVT